MMKKITFLLIFLFTGLRYTHAQSISEDSLQILNTRKELLETATQLNKLKIEQAKDENKNISYKKKADDLNSKSAKYSQLANKYADRLKQNPGDNKAAKKAKKYARKAARFTKKAARANRKYQDKTEDIESIKRQINELQEVQQKDEMKIRFVPNATQ